MTKTTYTPKFSTGQQVTFCDPDSPIDAVRTGEVICIKIYAAETLYLVQYIVVDPNSGKKVSTTFREADLSEIKDYEILVNYETDSGDVTVLKHKDGTYTVEVGYSKRVKITADAAIARLAEMVANDMA